MRKSQDLYVCTTIQEAFDELQKITYPIVSKRFSKTEYIDLTCTLDIETTNTPDDGFLYTVQFNIGGINILFRYIEDFIQLFDKISDWLHLCDERRLVLYVHNLGYEHYYMTQILDASWHVTGCLFAKAHKPLYIRYSNGIEFRDSLKLFQKSLASATKGLPHEKLVGDLDYRKYRTPDTPLSPDEWNYCINDVQGLYEAIERLKIQHGFNQSTIPFTNTSMVIGEINKYIRKDGKTIRAMKELQLTKRQMRLAYKCMAGGDTHGCRWRSGIVYENCNSYDLKSAHPSQQILRPFPDGELIDMEDVTETQMETLLQINHGWIAELIIIAPRIRPECPDPTISVSKCDEIIDREAVDNGRLLSASAIRVYMDSNDWQRFKDAYTYDNIEAPYLVAFHLKYLPDAFREGVLDKFKIKESAQPGLDRDFAKVCVNTIFGACAQKTVRDEYSLDLGDIIEIDRIKWEDNLSQKEDKDVAKSQRNKYPFLWGLWTSSLTRLYLWKLIKAVGWERAIYWDTDSVKYEGEKLASVGDYNEQVIQECIDRGAVVQNSKGNPVYIGTAEDEHPTIKYGYRRFTFLHAKCYAAEAWDNKKNKYIVETTIAGVGKAQGAEAMHGDISNLRDGLYIADAGGNKLFYNDKPIHTKQFKRVTQSASYIYMTSRDYEMRATPEKLEIWENDIIL